MEESARISRGNCKDLKDLKASDYDALLIPGGFGAAKNLSDFGFKGAEMSVDKEVEDIMREFKAQKKVIALTCISPIIAAKVFGKDGVKLTLGGKGDEWPYAGSIDAASSFGAQCEEQGVDGVTTDWTNDIVTTPAYMKGDAKPHEVYDGIQKFIRRVSSLVQQNQVVEEMVKTEHEREPPKTEDILTANLIQHSVNKIWNDYDTDNSGQLNFDESKVFISDSFGGTMVMKDADLKKMFDKIDTDGDGLINKGEMAVFLLKLTKF